MIIAIIGTLLNLLGAFSIAMGRDLPGLGWVMVLSGLVAAFGIVMAAAGQKKAGGYMIIGGSLIFVPLGLVAAYGGKQILQQHKEQQFAEDEFGSF